MTNLLKGELGFEGCIISDAMSIVGSAARVDLDKLAVTFLNCGGDMVLFNEPEDHSLIMNAVKSGILSIERLRDAARRVIGVKEKARLFENQDDVLSEITETKEELIKQLETLGDEIAEKSIKFVRNTENLLPLKAQPNSKFLCVEIGDDDLNATILYDELRRHGHIVDVCNNKGHKVISQIMNDYDYILINCFFIGKHGGTMRSG